MSVVLTCPAGHRFKIPRVVYGDPTPDTMAAAKRGEVTIGGCIPDVPVEPSCPTCGLMASSDPELTSRMTSERSIGGRTIASEPPI